MPIYILQKDWICPKFYNRKIILLSGAELIYNGVKYSTKCGHLFDKEVVENNPEWFKLKEDNKKIDVEIFAEYPICLRRSDRGEYYTYSIQIFSEEIKSEKLPQIKEAIEKALNQEDVNASDPRNLLVKLYYHYKPQEYMESFLDYLERLVKLYININ